MAEQQVKAKKTIKKSFFEVKSGLTGTKMSLYGTSMEELNGRVIRLDLTRSLRGKSLELKLRVKHENNALVGEPISLALAGSFIRRMIRKGTDYIEDSFQVECRDGKAIIKPFMITRNKVSRGVRNSLRVETKKFLEGYSKARTGRELFGDIMSNKIQKELSLKLKKIYPLALCEIRVFEVNK